MSPEAAERGLVVDLAMTGPRRNAGTVEFSCGGCEGACGRPPGYFAPVVVLPSTGALRWFSQ